LALDHGGSAEPDARRRRLPKSFLHPCLLLLLKEQPGYGYDLVVRLKALGIDDESPTVYRALRALEKQRTVFSYWCTSLTGPARRMYQLTPAGEEHLQAAVEGALETHRAIERFFCRHALGQARPPESDDTAPAGPTALQRLLRNANSSTGAAATP
jgi:DNA-binding PadR family transcriptional regulator